MLNKHIQDYKIDKFKEKIKVPYTTRHILIEKYLLVKRRYGGKLYEFKITHYFSVYNVLC